MKKANTDMELAAELMYGSRVESKDLSVQDAKVLAGLRNCLISGLDTYWLVYDGLIEHHGQQAKRFKECYRQEVENG